MKYGTDFVHNIHGNFYVRKILEVHQNGFNAWKKGHKEEHACHLTDGFNLFSCVYFSFHLQYSMH